MEIIYVAYKEFKELVPKKVTKCNKETANWYVKKSGCNSKCIKNLKIQMLLHV